MAGVRQAPLGKIGMPVPSHIHLGGRQVGSMIATSMIAASPAHSPMKPITVIAAPIPVAHCVNAPPQ